MTTTSQKSPVTEPLAKQAVWLAVIGIVIPVIPSVAAIFVQNNARQRIVRSNSATIGLGLCKLALILAVVLIAADVVALLGIGLGSSGSSGGTVTH